MIQKIKQYLKKVPENRTKTRCIGRCLVSFALALIVTLGTLSGTGISVQAADGTISFTAGSPISYGSYFTSRMTFDGSNTALVLCQEKVQVKRELF